MNYLNQLVEQIKPYELRATGYLALNGDQPEFMIGTQTQRFWTRKGLEQAVRNGVDQRTITLGQWDGRAYNTKRRPVPGMRIIYY